MLRVLNSLFQTLALLEFLLKVLDSEVRAGLDLVHPFLVDMVLSEDAVVLLPSGAIIQGEVLLMEIVLLGLIQSVHLLLVVQDIQN